MISSNSKPLSRAFDPSAPDPVFESLWRLAMSFEPKATLRSPTRTRCRSHGTLLEHNLWTIWNPMGCTGAGESPFALFILWNRPQQVELARKAGPLTKDDFIGLLGIVLHNSDLSPVSPESWMKRRPRIIELR